MKNPDGLIGNQTRDLPACSAVPKPTVQLISIQDTKVAFNLWAAAT